MAQPPLSQAIQSLEDELGVKLFIRTNRSVELTEAGKAYLAEIRQALSQVENAKTVARRTSQGLLGRLRLSFIFASGFVLLPKVLRGFKEKLPAVDLELQVMSTDEQIAAIAEEKIDIGFLRGVNIDKEGIVFESLWWDGLTAVLPMGHRLEKSPDLSLEQLKDEPFIVPPFQRGPGFPSSSFRTQVLSACQESGFIPKITQEPNQWQALTALVAAGMGVAIMPGAFRNIIWPGVVYKSIRGDSLFLQQEFGMAWLKGNTSPILSVIIDLVRQVRPTLPGKRGADQSPPDTGAQASEVVRND